MTPPGRAPERHFRLPATAAVVLLTASLLGSLAGPAHAATATVELGTAEAFAVLAGAAVTDVPVSTITGDVGVSPAAGSSITGLTCEEVDGTIYSVDDSGPVCRVTDPGLLTVARADQTIAYQDAAGRTPTTTYPDGDDQLGGDQTLVAGVYRFGSAPTANLVGNLTLDGDESSVWIFQATSDLVFASGSTVTLTGGAQACNVFWQVASSATLGTGSDLVGTVLADAGITARNRATIEGRLLAGTAVTLDMNTITRPGCAELPDTPVDEPVTPTDAPVTPTDEPESPVDEPQPVDSPDATGGVPDDDSADSPAGSGTGLGGSSQVRVVPTGGVAAGDGSTAASIASPIGQAVPLTVLLALLAVAGFVAVRADRRT